MFAWNGEQRRLRCCHWHIVRAQEVSGWRDSGKHSSSSCRARPRILVQFASVSASPLVTESETLEADTRVWARLWHRPGVWPTIWTFSASVSSSVKRRGSNSYLTGLLWRINGVKHVNNTVLIPWLTLNKCYLLLLWVFSCKLVLPDF